MTFRAIVEDVGGHANLAFDKRDVRNFIHKERRAIGKDGDGAALIAYFCKMREKNANFFYDIDLDDDFHVKNVFWADAKSRVTYESFGDLITFDTTYLTNKYDMPFAAFVGINHHGQSVLLGCGLLSNEDTSSFAWLFSSWLRCMSGKPPTGIVTDQCKAMHNVIEWVPVGELAAEFEDESNLLHETLDNLKHDLLCRRHCRKNVDIGSKGDCSHENHGQRCENSVPIIRRRH
ncbi:hypothetical protein RIF29_21474 [Crotalaria pallida]|uniref:MULE transposase domain-containing protein n=1 Tax=Crotalaria pallida TaxID=3830 RepID=A0AAN9IDF6_CROPI